MSVIKARISVFALIFFMQLSVSINGESILFFHSGSGYSHRVPHWPLVKALLNKGHEVTFISSYEGGKEMSHPNVTDIVPKASHETMQWLLSIMDVNMRVKGLQMSMIMLYEPAVYYLCEALLKSQEFQEWIQKSPKIDLIISDGGTECSYGLARKLRSKHSTFSTLPLPAKVYEAHGYSPEGGSVPDWDISYQAPLSFLQRVVGTMIPVIWRMNQLIFYNLLYPSLFTKYLGLKLEEFPDLYEMERRTSFILLNGGFIEDFPRSHPPYVVGVPAMHLGDNGFPLEPEIEKFISTNDSCGVIYMSFGTFVRASNIPEQIREIFFKSMESFPELKFIWRWAKEEWEQIPKVYPKNLMFVPWANQQKLLTHPKTKGFVTQAGRQSIQEAFYNGVPAITLPILGDQDYTANRYESLGTTIKLEISSFTQLDFENAIKRLVNDTSFRDRVKRLSEFGRDVPHKSVEKALWWTEFALRHSTEELRLMKPLGQTQYWFQRREIDTWAFIFIVGTMLSLVWILVMKKLLVSIFRILNNKYVLYKRKLE